MARLEEPKPKYKQPGRAIISEERELDSCHRLSSESPGGCSEECYSSHDPTYRLLKKEKQNCQIAFVGKLLGTGGFGKVNQVYDKARGLPLVLKTVKVPAIPTIVDGREVQLYSAWSFPFAEIDVLARMRSCYTPYLMDIVTSSQCADLAIPEDEVGVMMPLATNSLEDLIADRSAHIDARQLLMLLYSMARSVKVLHEFAFLHRDIKPGNFLCSDDQMSVLITDFGASCRLLYPGEAIKAQRNTGTEGFFAPEIFDRGYSEASDAFALGISMAELIMKPMNEEPLVNVADLESGSAVIKGIDFPHLSAIDQQLVYLKLALSRFGINVGLPGQDASMLTDWGVAETTQLLEHIANFALPDPDSRGSIDEFLRLAVFRRIRWQQASVIRTRIQQRPESTNWDAGYVWDLLEPARPLETRWIAHLLVQDLAQRVWSSGRGPVFARMAKFAPFGNLETAVFALAAVANVFPQLGLDRLAEAAMRKIAEKPGSQADLMERFASMARSESYQLEDLEILSCISSNRDAVVLHYLVMNPHYLKAKKRGLQKTVAELSSQIAISEKLAAVTAPSQLLEFDLATTYRDYPMGVKGIVPFINAFMIRL